MSIPVPQKPADLVKLGWSDLLPYYVELEKQELSIQNVDAWLADWSRLSEVVDEIYQRAYVEHSLHTDDEVAEKQYNNFLENIYPNSMDQEQKLKEKLLASKLEPKGFEIPLRNMRAESELYSPENSQLLGEEHKLAAVYEKIVGAQSVQWEGKELTVMQLKPIFQDPDRGKREKAWRLAMERQLADREAVNANWQKLLALRLQIARNADKPDYRAWSWQQKLRFDYTPDDAKSFLNAIEKAVVPLAAKRYEKRRQRLGVDTLRPWDVTVDPLHRPALKPYQTAEELKQKTLSVYYAVDPALGDNLKYMIDHDLMDIENRKGKAPGAYCTFFATIRKPFIFHNAVGLHDCVQTMLHEGGHAMHVFESAVLPYIQQLNVPMEFAEVASMGMELLASPYLEADKGGFYDKKDAARARIEHLESNINFWPYMAVVDAFQHWVYENPEKAAHPANCDAAWGDLWDRFMQGVDWSGFEDTKVTGWHRKLHIHEIPFYYIEYGLAQLGAVQIWANAMHDQKKAVADYRRALSLGGSVTLPELFQAAGARLAFDADLLGEMTKLMESKIEEYEKV